MSIRCRSVGRVYRRRDAAPVVAVDSVDLDVAPGEFVAIEGPSGSGKTTLLGLIAGLETPDSGTVELLGHDLARLRAGERARLRAGAVGIVLQSFGLLPELPVGENVALPLALSGADPKSRRRSAAAALEAVGLAHALDARVDELSGGERQRVGVARAVAGDPRVILADEPTGSLDEATAETVLGLLVDQARAGGRSLVLVTHDPESAARADRRLRMRDGRLAGGAA
jgi:ABC-type lipoprotein export system ATPase subunit